MDWITDKDPKEHGYYLAAWDDRGHWRVSELWFNPESHAPGWWPTRGYMARFVGDVATTAPLRSLTVAGWAELPEYPGPGRIIAYKTLVDDKIYHPDDVVIVREEIV